jgi:hypothetical protein
MRNGGLPPAHLPSSSLSDPSAWLQYKWSQPPPHAPSWVIADYQNSIPRPMLVVPFATRNGSNKHFAKTNRPPACCLQNRPGGPFYMGLAPVRNTHTGIGSGQLTNCGRTSTIASRRQPANAISTRKPLVNARRPFVANDSLMSVPPTNARRPSAVNGYSTRRLHVVSAFLTKRLLIALWPNALLLHNRW